ncbi:hypothetical protein [Xanthobacter autotrophicus]|uniref:hypothetical protein n=1 Tax=Xanthobacter autotrophicus TaxID=280 RepID=UPI003729B4DC
MSTKHAKTDWTRILKLVISILASAFVGYFFQPMITKNANAVNTVVTVFSVLAGFLIALLTLIAEPTLKRAKDWQELQLMKSTIERKLLRQKILFFMYLLTLGVAISTFLIPDNMENIRVYVEITFLGLTTFVFISSFGLPGSLIDIQMERYSIEMDKSKPKVLTDIGNGDSK